jgi:flavorubredoxin
VKAIVVYESMFGNTHRVAEAVAEGLKENAEVSLHPVSETPPDTLAGVDLIVVGGPTHIHGMASKMSHKAAADDAKKHPEHELDQLCATGSTESARRTVCVPLHSTRGFPSRSS